MLNGGQKSEPYWFRFASDKPQRKEQPTRILLSPSQLPEAYSWGVPLSPLQHVSRSLKVQNQHNCGICHKCHVEDKKKILLGKGHVYERPYGGKQGELRIFWNWASNWEAWGRMAGPWLKGSTEETTVLHRSLNFLRLCANSIDL